MAITLKSLRNSIGAKIFGAFVAMGLITGALGGYGLYVLSAAGRIVVDTYDRPLMAINYARSASFTFSQMDKEVLRRSIVAQSQRPAIDDAIAKLADSFFGDLEVAEQRSLAADERTAIGDIRQLVTTWRGLEAAAANPGAGGELEALAAKIDERFDMLIELTADHSFVERRKAVWSISYFQYTSIAASVLALLLSAGITWVLARRIIRPLSTAAAIADRIAGGKLQTEIPDGGTDETGILLRSMTVMQANIRVMMEREQAQRQSAQNRLVDALESSGEGMVLVDAAGHIVIANSQIATFFPAVSHDLVEGAGFAEAFARIRPHLLQRGASTDRRDLSGDSYDGEYQLLDGRWIRFSRSETQDGGFFLFLSDFTEIKEREESFKEAKHQAEAASTAKSNFLANMSHELRTPLNAIIGFSEVMSGELFGALGNPQYREYSTNILDSGRHLLAIINGVLDLAKSEAGKLQLSPESVDLREIVDGCMTMLREQCARAELTFEIALSDEHLVVWGESAKLRQIFLNLLSNAVKFTEPGGTLTLHAAAVEGFVRVQVVDTGIGMSPEDIPVALAPFGQVDSRLARRYEGTGLGLPLTKALVELHGGVMTIESELGKGTTVTVTLPKGATVEAAAAE